MEKGKPIFKELGIIEKNSKKALRVSLLTFDNSPDKKFLDCRENKIMDDQFFPTKDALPIDPKYIPQLLEFLEAAGNNTSTLTQEEPILIGEIQRNSKLKIVITLSKFGTSEFLNVHEFAVSEKAEGKYVPLKERGFTVPRDSIIDFKLIVEDFPMN